MNEYSFEIHTINASGSDFELKDDTQKVTAYSEAEATEKANRIADGVYARWRVRNLRLTKKYINPDGEI